MCVQALPAILSAVGSGVQMVGQNRALQERDRAVARGMRERELLRNEADSRVRRQIQDLGESTPEAERKQQNDAFVEALRKSKTADGGDDLGVVGGASDRFAADVGQARSNARTEGQTLSGQLAAIDAPGLQRQREARMFGDTATDLSMIGDRSKALDFLTQLRALNAGSSYGGVEGLGQGLQAFGQAYGARAKKPQGLRTVDSTIPGGT